MEKTTQCNAHQMLSGLSNREEDGRGMLHVWERGEMHRGFWWGDLRERDHFPNLGIEERMMLRTVLGVVGWGRGLD